MTKKTKKITTNDGFPVDDRPIIFNLLDGDDVNFVGRYVESDAIFMLSLNDTESDFVAESEVDEWWYIDEHPTILKEVINKKPLKKSKKKKVKDVKDKIKLDDSENKTDLEKTSNTHSFLAPPLLPIPPFLEGLVNKIQRETGVQFQQVNVRVVGEDDLDDLPKDILEQLLTKALSDEMYELATKIRNAINSKQDEK